MAGRCARTWRRRGRSSTGSAAMAASSTSIPDCARWRSSKPAGRWRWRRAAWSRPGPRPSTRAACLRARAGAQAAHRLHPPRRGAALQLLSQFLPGLPGRGAGRPPGRVAGSAQALHRSGAGRRLHRLQARLAHAPSRINRSATSTFAEFMRQVRDGVAPHYPYRMLVQMLLQPLDLNRTVQKLAVPLLARGARL